ncbi:hypothetical protein SBA3_2200006 [Candidatus Sulfopaludibacter sp. SbA3]|nr:hypothetical protein SBA3_2200006 [Candidatus Sulfopaludibacter sp. SbA3]
MGIRNDRLEGREIFVEKIARTAWTASSGTGIGAIPRQIRDNRSQKFAMSWHSEHPAATCSRMPCASPAATTPLEKSTH